MIMTVKNSISDRIKITKTGKILRRPMGLNHFRAKKSGKQIRAKRKYKLLYSPI